MVLPKEERLFEAQCVPTAILHFGTSEATSKYLKDEVLEKLSSPKSCLKIALDDRGLDPIASGWVSTGEVAGQSIAGTSNTVRRPNSDAFNISSAMTTHDEDKAPKWFKGLHK